MDAALLGPALSLASGVLLTLLGIGLIWPRPRRPSTLAFAAFCILWGALISLGNGSRLTGDDDLAANLTKMFLAIFVILYAPLVYFSDLYPSRRGWFSGTTAGGLLLLAPAALGALALAFAPSLLFAGFEGTGVRRTIAWGPLFPLLGLLLYASFLRAVLRLSTIRREARTILESKRATLVLVALLLYLGYATTQALVQFAMAALTVGVTAETGTFLATYAVGAVVLLAVTLRDRRREGKRIVALAFVLPAAFGLVSGFSRFATPSSQPLETLGLFRTASVVLIAYAILRFELFDIDVKVKRGAIVAALFVAAGLVALAVEQGLERILGSTGLAITATQFALFGAVVAVVMKAPTVARSLGEKVLPSLSAPERLDARRLEVYEAALAQAVAAGRDVGGDAFLVDLRKRLGVSEGEHALLARLVAGAPRAGATTIEAGALVANRYHVDRLLGEGASGAAWLATDGTLQRRVVLKALSPRMGRSEAGSRAFLHEARLLASLDHPNVVRVFDFGYSGETPYLALEYVEGGSLEERLRERGALSSTETRRLAGEILAGLTHVHARGVLHRDLKAANVLLTREAQAKLADFGVAIGASAHETMTGLEAPGPRGTPATMSPQAARGLPPTALDDLYSAGAVLYQMATGQTYLAFDGKTRAEIHRAILEDPPRPAPPEADEHLVRVSLKALAKAPEDRYHDAEEMWGALAAAPRAVPVA